LGLSFLILSTHQTDRILVLENGKITGDGSHETLYQANAYYRNLIQHQELNKK